MDASVKHVQTAGTAADIAVFAAPKRGHTPDEYEDAYAVSAADAWPLRAAVTDGATEAAFARHWAQVLAKGWVDEAPADPAAWQHVLPVWRRQWQTAVAGQTSQQPWYAAAKAEQGAFAAVLGLSVQPDGTWQALSIGDCELIHLRSEAVVTAWPFSHPDAFTNRPALVSSRLASNAAVAPVTTAGTWRDGDAFLLASDALAAWLLRTDPAAALGWEASTAAASIHGARADRTLANDDVTLVRLRLHAA
jgi:hypothetical protein